MIEREHALPAAIFSPAEHAAWFELEKQALATLEARMGKYRIPVLPYEPSDDGMLVYRLEAEERKTDAGIYLPDRGMQKEELKDRWGNTIEERHEFEKPRVINVGVLINAGLTALDWMRSHGVLMGDLIKFSKYGGQEESAHWFGAGTHLPTSVADMLELNVKEVRGSFDQWLRIQGPKPTMKKVFAVDDSGQGIYVLKPIVKEKK